MHSRRARISASPVGESYLGGGESNLGISLGIGMNGYRTTVGEPSVTRSPGSVSHDGTDGPGGKNRVEAVAPVPVELTILTLGATVYSLPPVTTVIAR